MRNPRSVVVFSFDMTGGHNLHQVLVAVVILCQEDKVIISSVILILQPVVIMSGYIDLTADNRLYFRKLLGYLQELFHTVHISMVSYGQCRHFQLFSACKEVADG